ncbi:MAG: TIGR02147 family protein [Bacteriovoracaceae bacterium]|nr:TIGR02147 family protein [Bacteriovoracaceae bacterium]
MFIDDVLSNFYIPHMNYREQYIQMLKTELGNRQSGNTNYSLRAFARDINLEAPRLSMILNSKKGLSVDKASEIVSHFSWAINDKEAFINFVQAAHGRSKKDRLLGKENIKEHYKKRTESIEKFVEDKLFKQIAEPIHYLIIEALKLNETEPTIEGLNLVINYPKTEIEEAVLRLESLDLLNIKNNVIDIKEYIINSGGKIPSMALRKHHSIQLQSAIKAINEQDVNTRALSSLTIAIPKEIIPEIFEKISEFRREINEYIINHENQNKTDVYCLSSQFFKLTTEKK